MSNKSKCNWQSRVAPHHTLKGVGLSIRTLFPLINYTKLAPTTRLITNSFAIQTASVPVIPDECRRSPCSGAMCCATTGGSRCGMPLPAVHGTSAPEDGATQGRASRLETCSKLLSTMAAVAPPGVNHGGSGTSWSESMSQIAAISDAMTRLTD